MKPSVNIQIASSSKDVPSDNDIEDWIRQTLSHVDRFNAELTVRVVDESEITDLNRTYRHKNAPTDVLAFPHRLPNDIDLDLLGDVVVCAGAVNRHATSNNISRSTHWARIIAHGILHLCGYDHEQSKDAKQMKLAEAEILKKIGFCHPELAEVES